MPTGLENQGSVHSARARLAAAQAELAQMQEQVGLQRNSIAALIGAAPDRGAAIARCRAPAITVAAAMALPQHLPVHLLGRRPDVGGPPAGTGAGVARHRSRPSSIPM